MRVLRDTSSALRLSLIVTSTLLLCGCPKLAPQKSAPGKSGGGQGQGQGQGYSEPQPEGFREKDVTGDEAAAKVILAAMEAAYANLDSYYDECEIRNQISFENTGFKLDLGARSTTAFVRPGVMRAETFSKSPFGPGQTKVTFWTGAGHHLRIVDGDVYSIEQEVGESDDAVLREAVVVEADENTAVLSLLFPDLKYPETPTYKSLTGMRVYGGEVIDGVLCHKLRGEWDIDEQEFLNRFATWDVSDELTIDAKVAMWIEEDTKLLRKVIALAKFKDMGSTETIAGGEVVIPTMRIWSRVKLAPRLNPKFEWHELLVNIPGDPDEPAWGWRAHDEGFTPTKKKGEDASKLARKVLKKTLDKYASAKTYEDKGVFHVAPVLEDSVRERTVRFETAFKRSGKFAYLSVEEVAGTDDKEGEGPQGRRRFAWRSGGSAKVWGTQDPGVQEYDTLQMPVDAISCDADSPIRWIAGLLVPNEVCNAFLANVQELTLLGYQDIDGARCYKLSGKASGSVLFNVWIEKKKKHIRRIEIKYPGLGLAAYCWAEYEPKLNEEIPEARLEYRSPPES